MAIILIALTENVYDNTNNNNNNDKFILWKIVNEIAQHKNTTIKYMFKDQNKNCTELKNTNLQAHAIISFLKLVDNCLASVLLTVLFHSIVSTVNWSLIIVCKNSSYLLLLLKLVCRWNVDSFFVQSKSFFWKCVF